MKRSEGVRAGALTACRRSPLAIALAAALGAGSVSAADEDRKIAGIVSSYWVNFATNGNPNGPVSVSSPPSLDFWKCFFQTQEAW